MTLDITVVEATHTRRGALCGRLLAELGAEVVLVEPPSGHPLRSVVEDSNRAKHYFEAFGAGKHSIVVEDPASATAYDDLVATADVFVTDREATAAGPFGESEVRARTDSVIYCSVTPYGRAGLRDSHLDTDLAVQAATGITATSGFPDSLPAASAGPVAATFGAFVACGSVVAALYGGNQESTIDVSTQDAVLPLLTTLLPEYFATGESVGRTGNQHPIAAPWNAFEAEDGWLYIVAYIDRDWERLTEAIDRPELASDDRFASVSKRREHADTINEIVQAWVGERSVEDVVGRLNEEDLTAVAIGHVDGAFEDENLVHRGMRVEANGNVVAGSPLAMSASPGEVRRSAPSLGDVADIDAGGEGR